MEDGECQFWYYQGGNGNVSSKSVRTLYFRADAYLLHLYNIDIYTFFLKYHKYWYTSLYNKLCLKKGQPSTPFKR